MRFFLIQYKTKEVEVTHTPSLDRPKPVSVAMKEAPKLNTMPSVSSTTKPPPFTPEKDKKKKKGLFGGLFGGLKKKEGTTTPASRAGSRTRNGRKLKG